MKKIYRTVECSPQLLFIKVKSKTDRRGVYQRIRKFLWFYVPYNKYAPISDWDIMFEEIEGLNYGR